MILEKAYHVLYVGALCVLAVLVVLAFIRAVKGPSIADRIVAINMIGTQVMIMVGVVAMLLREGYLVDVSLLYAMISFLAVVVLSKVYMGVFLERKAKLEEEGQQNA